MEYCQGITKIGKQCTKKSINGTDHCQLHRNIKNVSFPKNVEIKQNKIIQLFSEIDDYYLNELKDKNDEINLLKNKSFENEDHSLFDLIIEDKDRIIVDRNEEINKIKSGFYFQDTVINNQKTLIKNNNIEMNNVKKQLSIKNEIVNDQKKTIDENYVKMVNLKKQLNVKDKTINDQKKKIDDQAQDIKNKKNEIFNLNNKLNEQNKKINDLKVNENLQNECLNNLKMEINNLKDELNKQLTVVNEKKTIIENYQNNKNTKIKATESMKKLRDIIMKNKTTSSKIIINDIVIYINYHKRSIVGDIVEFEDRLVSELSYLTYDVNGGFIQNIISNKNNFNIDFDNYFFNYSYEWMIINENEYKLNISVKHDKDDVWNILILEVLNDQQKIREYADKNNNMLKCIICFNNDKNVVLFPCHHVICCNECINNSSIKLCPVCRIKITGHHIIYY